MSAYSVAEAKNRLPSLINKALAGEEVVITRHGKVVVELRAPAPTSPPPMSRDEKDALYASIRALREAGPIMKTSSVELMNELWDDPNA